MMRRGLNRALTLSLAVGALLQCAPSGRQADNAVKLDELRSQILPRALDSIASAEQRMTIRKSVIKLDARGWDAEPGQALTPDSTVPAEVYASGFQAMVLDDLTNSRVRTEWHRWYVYPGRAEFTYTDVVDRNHGYTTGDDSQFFPPFKPPFPLSRMFAARASAELKRAWMTQPMRLLERASERVDGALSATRVRYNGRPHYAVAVPGSVLDLTEMTEPIRVFIDAANYVVSATEAREEDPIYGHVVFTVRFSDWTANVRCGQKVLSDVKFPERLTYSISRVPGSRSHQIHFENRSAVDVCPMANAASLSMPSEVPPLLLPEGPNHRARGLNSTAWYLRMRAFGAAMDFDLETVLPSMLNLNTQIAPGLFLIPVLSHNVVVIEMPTYLIIVEAPINNEASAAVLRVLRSRWGDSKPVRYVVNTHYHHDHSGGLRHYATSGITLVAPGNTHDYYRDLYGIGAIRVPRNGALHRLSDGTWTVEIYAVDDHHVLGNLLVYLPRERILINADLFSPGEFDPNLTRRDPAFPIPPGFFTDNAAQLLDQTLPRLGIRPQLFVGIHGTVATRADLLRALGRK